MKKIAAGAVVIAMALLAGCGGPKVKEGEGGTPGFRLVEMEGGYIDQEGDPKKDTIDRLTPWVEIDKETGMAGNMGFTLWRVTNDREVLRQHTVRWLTTAPGSELQIYVGDESVTMRATEGGKRWHKNIQDSGGYGYTIYYEQVKFEADAADMGTIAAGKISKIMARGTKGAVIWPRNGKNILPDYSSKVSDFYNKEIAPHL